jgi:protein associated with RNAse G/E
MSFTVIKLGPDGREQLRYDGEVLERTSTSVTIEAFYTRSDRHELPYTVFMRGDRFVEHFFSDRWYNIFEIEAVGTGELKGWYCNVTRPALIEEDQVSAIDLALDLWVEPDGEMLVLDEEEFDELHLSPSDRHTAQMELTDLKRQVVAWKGPFARIARHAEHQDRPAQAS